MTITAQAEQDEGFASRETLVQLQSVHLEIAEEIEDRREAFFADPTDIETIHCFRTRTRALRSLVAFVKPWQRAKQNDEAQSILRKVVRYTSRLRELDVLQGQVSSDSDSSSELLTFCKKEASAERAEVLQILASERVARMFERAMTIVRGIAWKRRYVEYGLQPKMVRTRFDNMVEAVEAELAALDLTDAERTHDVRKRAKRVRYVAECNMDLLGADAVDVAKGMNAHQDDLGDVCDARANIRLINEFLERDLPEVVVRELTQIRAQNEVWLQSALEKYAEKTIADIVRRRAGTVC